MKTKETGGLQPPVSSIALFSIFNSILPVHRSLSCEGVEAYAFLRLIPAIPNKPKMPLPKRSIVVGSGVVNPLIGS